MNLLGLGFGIGAGFWARAKSYSFWCFVFTGLLGVMALLFLPKVSSILFTAVEEEHASIKRGNTVGVMLTGVMVLIAIGVLLRSFTS